MGDSTTTNAASSALPPAFAVGEHIALDFLNSIASPKGQKIEWLGSGIDLLHWLGQMGLVVEAEALGHFRADEFDATADKARQLREEIRGAVYYRVEKGMAGFNVAQFKRLNGIFAADNRLLELVMQDKQFKTQKKLSWQNSDEVLLPIADAIADLFCHGDFALIRRCDNPKCPLLFIDKTKSHRRRFCSASICGNRAKAAAFRARQKSQPAKSPGRNK